MDSSSSNNDEMNEVPIESYSIEDFINAVRFGSRAHVAFLLGKDKSLLNKIDGNGHTCMHFAAKRGEVEVLEELHAAGANFSTPSSFDAQMVPMHWAASDNRLKSLKFLLEHYRQDVNATDANGCTPLIIATQYGHIEAVAYLIKNGADLYAKDYNGDTALHWAAYKGYEELVGLLLHFVPLLMDAEDNYGQSPLHLAALRGNLEVVRYLIEDFGADPSLKDKNGCTPIALTVKKHQFATEWVIRRLVSKGSVCSLVINLGVRRLFDRRVLINLFMGSNDLEVTAWIWRLSLVSNAIATYASIQYAASSLMSDYYWLHTINITLQCLFWILFPLCLLKSPGFVADESVDRTQKIQSKPTLDSSNNYHPHSYDAAIELMGTDVAVDGAAADGGMIPGVCHTCRVQKPLRSKHCKFAKKCVLKFDHFCPYIYNSVGRDNYKYFVACVTCFTLCSACFLLTSFLYWYRCNGSFNWIFTVFIAYSMLMLLPICGLASYHIKLLMINMTTNEEANAYRYTYLRNEFRMFSNPFDRGDKWSNILDGLFPSKKLYYHRDDVRRDIRVELGYEDESQSKLLSEV